MRLMNLSIKIRMRNIKNIILLIICFLIHPFKCDATQEITNQIFDDLGKIYEYYYPDVIHSQKEICNGEFEYSDWLIVEDAMLLRRWEWDSPFDFNMDYGIYKIALSNTPHGLVLIMLIENNVISVFPCIEEYRPSIIRRMLKMRARHPEKMASYMFENAINCIMYPYGDGYWRRSAQQKHKIGMLNLYFNLTENIDKKM